MITLLEYYFFRGTSEKINLDDSFLVIGAGMARTGTNSLQLALQIALDKPVMHGYTLLPKSKREVQRWSKLLDAVIRDPNVDIPRSEFGELLRGFRASTDIPVSALTLQIAKAYPEAKVVLSVRDPKEWLDSIRATLLPYRRHFNDNWVDSLAGFLIQGPWIYNMAIKAFRIFIGPDVDLMSDDQLLAGFQAWTDRVRSEIAPDRLLVYDVRSGWEPLCEFLGRPVPSVPFPRVNDKYYISALIKRMSRKRNAIYALVCAGLTLLMALLTYKVFK